MPLAVNKKPKKEDGGRKVDANNYRGVRAMKFSE